MLPQRIFFLRAGELAVIAEPFVEAVVDEVMGKAGQGAKRDGLNVR